MGCVSIPATTMRLSGVARSWSGFSFRPTDAEKPTGFSILPRSPNLYIDFNSPQAEISVLDTLFERVSPGGFIIFDDYGWRFFRKQKEHEDAFMARHGYRILELPTGQRLVIKR